MNYGVIILGAGPAGLTAGMFLCRAGIKTLALEKLTLGGQTGLTSNIQNYPGFDSVDGITLTTKMAKQAKSFGLEIKFAETLSLTKKGGKFIVKTKTETYEAEKVIIATGCKARKLGLENEDRLTGKGISFCASCDGYLFKGKTVAVVGGGASAVEYVDYLSSLAKKVYLINRSEVFRAGNHEIERIKKYKNLTILSSTQIKKFVGEDVLTQVEIETKGKRKTLKLDGVFEAVGHLPNTDFVKFDLAKDEFGFIIADEEMKTSVKNLYACGDVINRKFKQVVTAAAYGAIAANSCIKG